MSNELKLTKSQAKNLDLLSKIGSLEYVTKRTVKRFFTSEGEIRDFRGSYMQAQAKGFNLTALENLEKAGLVCSTASTTYSKDYSKERTYKGPVGSWYKTVTVFTIN